MNRGNNNNTLPQRYSILFLCVLTIFTIAFICYLRHTHEVTIESQQRIIESYAKHIEKADSLYCNIAKYNKDIIMASNNIENAILSDSLIIEALRPNKSSIFQRHNLETIISNHYKECHVLHKQYDEKLAKDSLRLSTERELLEGQTRAMLELHLGKIEHEYSNITMWGAVLTILFLVFSFYSIFKMDELIKQGKEGVDDIKELKKEGRQIEKQYKDSFEKTKLKLTINGDEILRGFEKQLSDFSETYISSAMAKQKDLDGIVTRANSILEDFKNSVSIEEGGQKNG